MHARISALAIVGATSLAVTVVWAQTRVTSNRERRFFSAREGVGLEAPSGWTLSTHTGYPTVIAAFLHPGGGRISIAVDQTRLATSAALADQNRPGLLAQGFALDRVTAGPHGGIRIDARAPRRNQVVRQLYVVREVKGTRDGHQAIVVSLTATSEQLASVAGAFEWAMAHLTLEMPVRLDEKADAGH